MRAVIYARYSSTMQNDTSIEAQLRACDEYINNQKGWIKKDEYIDRAVSARSDQRPEFQHMIEDAKLGKFDVIVIHKLDRFSRDRYDHSHYKRILKQAGVKLVSVTERLDDTPEGVVLESVLEGFSEYYSLNLKREVMKGLKETAMQCKHTGGCPPLGYDLDHNKKYIINEHEAEAVRYIFKAYLRGDGYSSIVDWLDEKGYKGKRGGNIAKNSIHSILRNEKYTGVYIFNRSAAKDAFGHRNGHKNKPDDEIIKIEGGMPVIISKETYQEAMAKMNKNRSGKHRAKEPYLLSGLLYCGKCDAPYIGSSRGNPRSATEVTKKYYECSNRKRTRQCDAKGVNRDLIEEMVISKLESLCTKKSIDYTVAWINDNVKTFRKKTDEEIARLKKQVKKASRDAEKLLDKILDGLDSPTARNRLEEAEQRKLQLELKLSDMYESSATTEGVNKVNLKLFLKQLGDIRDVDRENQRRIIHQFVDKIIIYPPDSNNDNDRDITIKTKLDCFLTGTARTETVELLLRQTKQMCLKGMSVFVLL